MLTWIVDHQMTGHVLGLAVMLPVTAWLVLKSLKRG